MNTKLAELQKKLEGLYGRGSLKVQKYSPEILLGVGLIGAIFAAVLAAKATLDVEPIIEKHVDDIGGVDANSEGSTTQEVMKEKATIFVNTGLQLGKLYGPSLGLGVLSFSAILASHGIMANRQVSLIAAFNLVNEGWKSYRERVVEEFGAGKDLEFKLGLREKTYTEKQVSVGEDGVEVVTKVKKHAYATDNEFKSVYARFFDESNVNYNKNSRAHNAAFLIHQQNYFNDILTIEGIVFLNDVYKALGFPTTKAGQLVGWVLRPDSQMKAEKRDGYISFGILDLDTPQNTREFVNQINPTVLLDFNVDGIVLDYI